MIFYGCIIFDKNLVNSELDARAVALAFQNSVNIGKFVNVYDKIIERPFIQKKLKSTVLYKRYVEGKEDTHFQELFNRLGWWCCSPMGIDNWDRPRIKGQKPPVIGKIGDAIIMTEEMYNQLDDFNEYIGDYILDLDDKLNGHHTKNPLNPRDIINKKWLVHSRWHQ